MKNKQANSRFKIRYCCFPSNRKKELLLSDKVNTGITQYMPKYPVTRVMQLMAASPYEFIYDERQPDVIFLPHYTYSKNVLKSRRLWGRYPVLIGFLGENAKFDLRYMDRLFSGYASADPKRVTVSEMLLLLNLRPRFPDTNYSKHVLALKANALNNITRYSAAPKSRFCNFFYSNDSSPETIIRRLFCKSLMRYKHIDCAGRSLNNIPASAREQVVSRYKTNWRKGKWKHIKDYKFTIAFENQASAGYVTEKILDPLLCGSIPIYWGAPDIADYYNPDAFINCHDYNTFDEVIERVIEVDNNPILYQKYRNAPPMLPGSHYDDMSNKVRMAWEDIVSEILSRRDDKQTVIGKQVFSIAIFWQELMQKNVENFSQNLSFTKKLTKSYLSNLRRHL